MAKRGSPEDFWRAAAAGARLAADGWTPASLEIDRVFPLRVGSRVLKTRHRFTLNRYGCHGWVHSAIPEGYKLSRPLQASALRSHGIRVERLLRYDDWENGFRWPISSLHDLYGADRTRRERWRIKIPTRRRADFILRCLKRESFWRRNGWFGFFLEFRRFQRFRASEMTWSLFQAHYFALREGFYWVGTFYPVVSPGKYRALLESGYLDRVAKELRRMGFKVLRPDKHGLNFDQHFLPSAELLRKSRQLMEWRPPKVGPVR